MVSQKRSSSVALLHLRLVDSDVVHLGAVEGGDILVIFVEIEGLPENTLSPSDHQLLSFWRCNCPQGRLGQRTANQRDGPHLHPILTTNFSQDISQISHNMLKICQRYAQDMPEICSRYAKDMPNISPKYAKICLIYHQNINIQDISKITYTQKALIFSMKNIARIAKAASHKLPGKLSSNVRNIRFVSRLFCLSRLS